MDTKVFQVHPEFPQKDSIAYCGDVIRQGGLVIFPTETVYGLAADYRNPRAMERLRAVKRRSLGKPFSVLVHQKSSFLNLASVDDPSVYKLIDRFWPGPLTVVVPASESPGTIGIRMPDHPVALSLVREFQGILAAPSANIEGQSAPVTCEEALKSLNGQVEAALDAGPSRLKRGSTVVDCTQLHPKVLREGKITQLDIDKVAEQKTVLFVCTGNSCRSVMAEYLLRSMLSERDDVEVTSAGTGVYIKSQASEETVNVLNKEGVDASHHEAQPLHTVLVRKADLILVMTAGHRQYMLERYPEVEKRVYLLREFANVPLGSSASLDVPDPIGRSPQAYEECLWMIKEAVAKISKLL